MSYATIGLVVLAVFLFGVLLFLLVDYLRYVKTAEEQPWGKLWSDSDVQKDLEYPRTREQAQQSLAKRQPGAKD